MARPRIVVNLGRRRLTVRFGRHRFGFHRPRPGACTFGLGLCCGSCLRRAGAAAPRWSAGVANPDRVRAGRRAGVP
jgi:hypothetical protein